MTGDLAREARERGRFLDATSELSEREALTVAWSELGFSDSGIATRIGNSEGTVKTHREKAAVRYGHAAIESKVTNERENRLVEVTREDIFAYPEGTREWWIGVARDNRDIAPECARNLIEQGENNEHQRLG